MEKITLLGTGNAGVTRCYNACFTLSQGNDHILVDGGGGNGILVQLESAQIEYQQLHHIIITHAHTDHLFGVIWVIRMIAAKISSGKYHGNLHLYAHQELGEVTKKLMYDTLPKRLYNLLNDRIIMHTVKDGESLLVLEYAVTFFDIFSTKLKQYGFSLTLHSGKRFTFLGDEPYNAHEYEYVYQADWLLHEAFCLYEERERFKPYEKHHATVKEACEVAEQMEVKNLLLFHTEDKCIEQRKLRYTQEGQQYYSGNLFVPNDLEVISL